jgi:hypothetical protein
LNNIWYDKIEPFHANLSGVIRLLLSICTFGLLAPVLISFREDELVSDNFFNEQKRNNEAEEKKVLLPRKMNRYRF